MKQLYFLSQFILLAFLSKAQTITDVVAKQDGNQIIVTYNLQCTTDAGIGLYISEKGDGSFTGPLKNVTGDVGTGIKPGKNTIIWNPLSEQEMVAGDNVVFRVVGLPKFSGFTDNRDGKTYKTVQIGNQIIMAENLNINRGNNWCYNNETTNCTKYGRMYDWETAKTICPAGWHLPSKDEFENLLQNIGGGSSGGAFNAIATSGKSGFDVLFGGYRDKYETCLNIGTTAYFWSSLQSNPDNAWYFCVGLKYQGANMMGNLDKRSGISVRCFRD